MSYKAFEFTLKTEYVFAEHAAEALKTQLERRKPAKVMLLALPFMAHIPTHVLEELGIPYVIRTDVISNPTDVFVNSCAAEASADDLSQNKLPQGRRGDHDLIQGFLI